MCLFNSPLLCAYTTDGEKFQKKSKIIKQKVHCNFHVEPFRHPRKKDFKYTCTHIHIHSPQLNDTQATAKYLFIL